MLEIAAFTAPSAITASQSGASRIELCTSYSLGGTTPPLSTLSLVRSATHLPITVMIRPRGGDFVYSASEYTAMESEIANLKGLADGFVFGILDTEGRLDEERCMRLVRLAEPRECTFHRAIDAARDLHEGVEAAVRCGFRRVLTSGGEKSAVEGVERIRGLQEVFGGRIEVIAGGGVRSGNVEVVKGRTGVPWVHSAAVTGEGEDVDGEEVGRIREVLEGM
ncbi:copper homeostasis protein CutC [Bipolaris maydis]|nr:copper homeostasis protein CutC [Bipolaris maydis]